MGKGCNFVIVAVWRSVAPQDESFFLKVSAHGSRVGSRVGWTPAQRNRTEQKTSFHLHQSPVLSSASFLFHFPPVFLASPPFFFLPSCPFYYLHHPLLSSSPIAPLPFSALCLSSPRLAVTLSPSFLRLPVNLLYGHLVTRSTRHMCLVTLSTHNITKPPQCHAVRFGYLGLMSLYHSKDD